MGLVLSLLKVFINILSDDDDYMTFITVKPMKI